MGRKGPVELLEMLSNAIVPIVVTFCASLNTCGLLRNYLGIVDMEVTLGIGRSGVPALNQQGTNIQSIDESHVFYYLACISADVGTMF